MLLSSNFQILDYSATGDLVVGGGRFGVCVCVCLFVVVESEELR